MLDDELETLAVTLTAQSIALASAKMTNLSNEWLVLTLSLIYLLYQPSQFSILAVATVVFLVVARVFYPNKKYNNNHLSKTVIFPHVTFLRASISFLTMLVILAVDFEHFFPHRFTKSLTYGVSLMDIGVGLVVYFGGVSAGLKRSKASDYKEVITKSVLPLIVLGLGRSLFVAWSGYKYSVSEYGVHWNFFLTLAVLPVSELMINKSKRLYAGLGLLALYQLALLSGLESWLLSDIAPRSNLLSQNKEGIFSTIGYTAIYLLASYFNINRIKLIGSTLISLAVYACTQYLHLLPSRRSCNLPYVAWVIAFSGLHHLLLQWLFSSRENKKNAFNPHFSVPRLFEAISYNQLSMFLLANVLTGIANLTMDLPVVKSPWIVTGVLCGYSGIIFSAAYFLHTRKLRLK